MKRVLFLAAALAVLGPAPAMAAGAKAPKLKGACIWQSVSYQTTSGAAANAGPVTTLAQLTFDGQGNVTIGDYDVNNNGTFGSLPSIQGTYQIDSNGHGSFTYMTSLSNRTLTFDFFFTRKRKSLKIMLQSDSDPPPLPRVASGECRFDE